jgi:hypothetical protein
MCVMGACRPGSCMQAQLATALGRLVVPDSISETAVMGAAPVPPTPVFRKGKLPPPPGLSGTRCGACGQHVPRRAAPCARIRVPYLKNADLCANCGACLLNCPVPVLWKP